MLDHLTHNKIQVGGVSALDHLISKNDLSGQLQAFLLSCRVDELSSATLSYYSYQVGAFVRFCLEAGRTDAQHITAEHIRLFLLKLQETNNKTSVYDYYRAVKRFFNWLVAEGILKRSPMTVIRPPKKEDRLIQPFKPEHIQDLLLLCDNSFLGTRNKAIILTFLDTGLRLSELANIQLADIDFAREIIKVMGKGAKERVVRIGKRAQKALLRYLLMRSDAYPCLWLSEERRPLTAWGIQEMIRKLGKRAGFNGIRCSPHTFRHTFGTQALRNKADIREVQSLLGHSTLKTTLRYVATVNSEDAVISHKSFSPADRMNLK